MYYSYSSDVPVILEEESTKQAEEKPKVASQEPSQEPLKEKEVKEEEKSKEPVSSCYCNKGKIAIHILLLVTSQWTHYLYL